MLKSAENRTFRFVKISVSFFMKIFHEVFCLLNMCQIKGWQEISFDASIHRSKFHVLDKWNDLISVDRTHLIGETRAKHISVHDRAWTRFHSKQKFQTGYDSSKEVKSTWNFVIWYCWIDSQILSTDRQRNEILAELRQSNFSRWNFSFLHFQRNKTRIWRFLPKIRQGRHLKRKRNFCVEWNSAIFLFYQVPWKSTRKDFLLWTISRRKSASSWTLKMSVEKKRFPKFDEEKFLENRTNIENSRRKNFSLKKQKISKSEKRKKT